MAPIPSPYFPEPVTVPGNVAAGDYRSAVRFLRTVGLGHLLSLAGIVALTMLLRRTGAAQGFVGQSTDAAWLATLVSLALLAWLRRGPLALQVVAFIVFALSFSASLAVSAPFLFDEFIDFAYAFRLAFISAWVGLVVYNLLAARDYSLVGQCVLVVGFTGLAMVYFTNTTYINAGQGFSVWVLVSAMLFYWVYDLAMVSRRRTKREPFAAVFDLYRDVLNFVGFPLRVMRMPKGRKRLQAKW